MIALLSRALLKIMSFIRLTFIIVYFENFKHTEKIILFLHNLPKFPTSWFYHLSILAFIHIYVSIHISTYQIICVIFIYFKPVASFSILFSIYRLFFCWGELCIEWCSWFWDTHLICSYKLLVYSSTVNESIKYWHKLRYSGCRGFKALFSKYHCYDELISRFTSYFLCRKWVLPSAGLKFILFC